MKTNRNKFLHIWKQQLAIVVPHLHFDTFLHRICQNVFPLTVICVWDGEKPRIPNILYISGGGSFAKSSNIGVAYAQSLGFSYVCLINDDVEIFLDQIIELLKNIEESTDLISPCTFNEKEKSISGIYVNDFFGYTRCISGKMIQLYQFFIGDTKNLHSLGACMIFRSSFRIDDRYPHGMEDVEFSKRIKKNRSIENTKIVSNVSVLHQGQKTSKHYSYDNEKKSLQGRFLLFEQRQTRLIVGSFLHVICNGNNKRQRFIAIKHALEWNRDRLTCLLHTQTQSFRSRWFK